MTNPAWAIPPCGIFFTSLFNNPNITKNVIGWLSFNIIFFCVEIVE
jgi:hypothetical protein